jgi:N-acylneuraminate cytidylyltransferase
MKIVVIVPIKSESKRVPKKNFKKVNKKPLYTYVLNKLKKCNFDEIYVDSDSLEIRNYCKKNNYNFIQRKPKLALDTANGNDLLNYHSTIIKADIYFQIFITAPLLKIKTINKCIEIIKKTKKKLNKVKNKKLKQLVMVQKKTSEI